LAFSWRRVQLYEESLIDAVKREISEETGLEVSDLTVLPLMKIMSGKYGLTHYLFFF
jgi:8-oxo-dGTP pyrophosphatase MutT (NUDIX family)